MLLSDACLSVVCHLSCTSGISREQRGMRQVQRWSWERIGRGKLLLRCVCSEAREALGRPQGESGGNILCRHAHSLFMHVWHAVLNKPKICHGNFNHIWVFESLTSLYSFNWHWVIRYSDSQLSDADAESNITSPLTVNSQCHCS